MPELLCPSCGCARILPLPLLLGSPRHLFSRPVPSTSGRFLSLLPKFLPAIQPPASHPKDSHTFARCRTPRFHNVRLFGQPRSVRRREPRRLVRGLSPCLLQ